MNNHVYKHIQPILATVATMVSGSLAFVTQFNDVVVLLISLMSLGWWIRLWTIALTKKKKKDSMKKQNYIWLAILLPLVASFAACGTMDKLLLDREEQITVDESGNVSTNLVYVTKPELLTGAGTASQINTIATPPPFNSLVELLLAAGIAGTGYYARQRSKKLSSTERALELSNDVLNAVIAGVEKAASKETKAAIKEQAKAAKVQPALDSLVNK